MRYSSLRLNELNQWINMVHNAERLEADLQITGIREWSAHLESFYG